MTLFAFATYGVITQARVIERGQPFQTHPTLICKARSLPRRGASERYFTQVGFSLTHTYHTRLERLPKGKHSSLFCLLLMSKKKCLIALTLGVKVMTLFVFATYGVTTEARLIEPGKPFQPRPHWWARPGSYLRGEHLKDTAQWYAPALHSHMIPDQKGFPWANTPASCW